MPHNEYHAYDFTEEMLCFPEFKVIGLKYFVFKAERFITVDEPLPCVWAAASCYVGLLQFTWQRLLEGKKNFLALIKQDGSLGLYYVFHSWLWWNEEPLCL